jgi:hypothetical protein
MAYDRYDTRGSSRDERGRWSDEGYGSRDRGRNRDQDRGFFERAGDEISSWFGDEDAERRRERDRRLDERGYGESRYGRDRSGDRWRERSSDNGDRERDRDRDSGGFFSSRGYRDTSGEGGREPSWTIGRDERGYRPITGDYGRSEGLYAGERVHAQSDPGRAGSMDPHYHSWRRRQMDELDRDYDDYRRENQARFEDDFSNWRQRRGQKRGLLGSVREHMEVVGNNDEHVGTVDRVAGDRVILTRSDPESGGVHHSLSCSDIDRVEDNRVILDCSSEQARQRWRDESRNRALFEREDQGEMGPRILDRSFEGTYR